MFTTLPTIREVIPFFDDFYENDGQNTGEQVSDALICLATASLLLMEREKRIQRMVERQQEEQLKVSVPIKKKRGPRGPYKCKSCRTLLKGRDHSECRYRSD